MRDSIRALAVRAVFGLLRLPVLHFVADPCTLVHLRVNFCGAQLPVFFSKCGNNCSERKKVTMRNCKIRTSLAFRLFRIRTVISDRNSTTAPCWTSANNLVQKYSGITSVVDKDLSLKAKAKAKDLTSEHVQGPPRTALDYGVRENIKLRKSNSTVAHVHAINTLFTDLWSTVESFMRWKCFLADSTATQYDRLLPAACCPSVCPSVCL